MAATVERIWADDHPEGMYSKIVGPIYHLYNFAIDGDQPKPQHQEFIQSTEFSVFLNEQLRRGRAIAVVGVTSESGRHNTNLALSRQRAALVRERIILQIIWLQRRGQFDQFDNAYLNQMITANGIGYHNLYLYQRGDEMRIPIESEGMGYAMDRAVVIGPHPAGRLSPAQIEIIGREYINANYRHLKLPRDFRFNELWTPTTDALRLLVPNPVIYINGSSATRRGSKVPPRINWAQYSPGYRAMDAFLSNGSYTQMSDKLQNHFFTPAEVHRAIRELMNEADAARNFLHSLERELVRWVNQSGAAGGGGSAQGAIGRYQNFRKAIFLRDGTCLFQFNGFRPVIFTGVTLTADGQYVGTH